MGLPVWVGSFFYENSFSNISGKMYDKPIMSPAQYDVVIFEDNGYVNLLPLVYIRPVFDLRCGARTLRQRIGTVQGSEDPVLYVRPEIAAAMADNHTDIGERQGAGSGPTLFINGRCLLFEPVPVAQGNLIAQAGDQIAYVWADAELACKLSAEVFIKPNQLEQVLASYPTIKADITLINYPWDLVHNNIKALEHDWRQISEVRREGKIYEGAYLLAEENISIAPGTVIKPGVVLDAEEGPIIIDENVIIKPHCTLEGPLYIGPGSLIQPGAEISAGVSIGPVCKVGGELESSIIHGYSNKQHDGFLGHSYIGAWVNLAADTVNSDLKNTYGPVRVLLNGREVDSGQMFVGLTMGDHSKTSINTMFSTGSVVGFACAVFTSHYVPRFLPSFSWLTDEGRSDAIVEKVLEVAQMVMARRNVTMSAAQEELFLKVYEIARQTEKMPHENGS
jgi:UDP-N-acetylglucosamine diphosphorylase/glucosamine-1-phosphate N-acetyltransferase